DGKGKAAYIASALQQLRAHPEVEEVGVVADGSIFYSSNAHMTAVIPATKDSPEQSASVPLRPVSPGLLGMCGMPIVRGSDLSGPIGEPGVVINEAFAKRYFPRIDPVGRRISGGGVWITIVGVARDRSPWTSHSKVYPEAFIRYSGDKSTMTEFFVRTRVAPTGATAQSL